MPDLHVTRALPNPAGKDRTAGRASNEQLNGEWVEFQNVSQQSLLMGGIAIFHYTFNRNCEKTGEESLMTFSGRLEIEHSVRLHTGSGTVWADGTLHHLYLGRGNYA